jgi:ABC-type hemin transport system substrate-binding protein
MPQTVISLLPAAPARPPRLVIGVSGTPSAGSTSGTHKVDGVPPVLRLLRKLLRRVAAPEQPVQGPWHAAAVRVHARDTDWQPLHEAHISRLQQLEAPLILAWEPEQENGGAVLPEIEPCHIGTLDQVGSADLDADLVTVPAPRTLSSLCDAVLRVGHVVGHDAAAEAVVGRMRADMRSINQKCLARERTCPRVLVLRGLAPYQLAGGWTPELVGISGGEALEMSPGDGSQTITWQRIAVLAPEIILLLVEGATLSEGLMEAGVLADEPGWWHLPAVVNNAVYAAHAADILDASPGVVRACGTLARIFRPEADWESRTGTSDGVLVRRLAMKPRQRCRGAFLHQFFVESVV